MRGSARVGIERAESANRLEEPRAAGSVAIPCSNYALRARFAIWNLVEGLE